MKYTLNRSEESTQPEGGGALTGGSIGATLGDCTKFPHHAGCLLELLQTISLIQSYYFYALIDFLAWDVNIYYRENAWVY